ncbi:hypothetical protein ACN4EG_17115 [Alkalinema pantanalense CENA528]|uniref:hypothetical protein n=1 Tax=Alkalinema pantanalense TaxID=1620705 RepID=UPI003D6E5E41
MKKRDWQVVDRLARYWVEQRTDDTEVRRLVSYLRQLIQRGEAMAGYRMFEYVRVLKMNGAAMQRSNQTTVHYEEICEGFEEFLEDYRGEPQRLLEVLGWTGRVMRYYKGGKEVGSRKAER